MWRRVVSWVVAISIPIATVVGWIQHAQANPPEANPTAQSALLTVNPPAGDSSDAAWQREIATHATLMTHDAMWVVLLANDKSPIRRTEWFTAQGNEDAARVWLRAHVRAEPVPGTRLIRVYLDAAPAPARDERIILESLVDAYITEQIKAANEAALERAQALVSLKTKYEIRIRELSDKQNNLMLRMGIGAVGAPTVYTTTDLELREAMSRQADQRAAATAAHAKRNALKADFAAGTDPIDLVHAVNRDQEVSALRSRISETEADIAAANAENDAAAAKKLQAKRDSFTAQFERIWKQKCEAYRQALFAQADSEAITAESSLNLIDRRVEQLKGVLGDLAIAMSDYLSVTDELAQIREANRKQRDEIDRLSSAATVPPVKWAQRPVAAPK